MDEYTKAAWEADTKSPQSHRPVGGFRKMHVDVGKYGKNKFDPSDIQELPGTTIQFKFHHTNHSVVESSFDKPCVPLEGGFSSGFIPDRNDSFHAVFNIQVPENKTMFFYDAQGWNCQNYMVGAINA